MEDAIVEVPGVWAENVLIGRYDGPQMQWVQQGRSENSGSEPTGMFADDSGVVVAGTYHSSDMVFLPGSEDQTDELDCQHGACGYVVRFDKQGQLQWIYQPAGDWGITVYDMAPTQDGFALSGTFGTEAIFGEGEENETLLTSGFDLETMFVSKHEANGHLIWAKSEQGVISSKGLAVTTTPSGAVVVTGYYRAAAVFGAGTPNETSFESNSWDAYVARYDADGNFEWAKRGLSEDQDWHQGNALVALADDSVIFLGFAEGGGPTFGEGEESETKLAAGGFTFARYAADGSLLWAKRGADGNVRPFTAVALPDGDIVVGGTTNSACAFGVGEPNQVIFDDPIFNSMYGFVARYHDDGALVWIKRYGQSTSYLGDNAVHDLALSPDGKALYVTGSYGGVDVVFAEGEPNELTLSSYKFPQTIYDTPVGAVLMRLVP